MNESEVYDIIKTEYTSLRNEITLRIQLQNNVINYSLILSGIFVTAISGWVIKNTDGTFVEINKLLTDSAVTLKAVVVIGTYLFTLEMLLCNWIYQLYRMFHISAYITYISRQMTDMQLPVNSSSMDLFGYQRWRGTSEGQIIPKHLKMIWQFIELLQPLVLYALISLSLTLLCVLVYCGNQRYNYWFIPLAMTAILLVLIIFHWSTLSVAQLTKMEKNILRDQSKISQISNQKS